MKQSVSSNGYRTDIDGLRALAILPVVLYHLKVSFTPGGFVGVDIFFVISGYLITGLIFHRLQAGTYSIADFYHRRVRRIFPALFFLLAVCIAAATAWLMPYEIIAFKDSLIAAVLFVSNIYFYATSDYFAQNADTMPLLHMWSLAVEEQFYILFPLLLFLLLRYARRQLKFVIGIVAASSFAVSAWLTSRDQPAAFYLLQSRAWELMIGSLLAIGAVPIMRNRLVAELCGGTGVLLILYGVATYTDRSPFPGFLALAPCLGAACIIHSAQQVETITARLLSIWPLRFIGLISYSLYLWHWPINVFAQELWLSEFGKAEKAVVLGLSLICAALSWWFIEKPFRQQPHHLSRRQIFGLSGSLIIGFIVIAPVMMPVSTGLWHLPGNIQKILSVLNERFPTRQAAPGETCFVGGYSSESASYDARDCLAMTGNEPNVLLIGDSHGAHLWSGLSEIYPHVNFMQATASGCKPLMAAQGQRRCTDLMDFIFDDFLPTHHLDAIVIAARWKNYDLVGLKSTIERIAGYADRVIVIGPTVEYKSAVPRLVALSILWDDESVIEHGRLPEQQQIDAQFAAAFQKSKVTYFSVYHAICPAQHCQSVDDDGLPLEFDYGHFTKRGSIYVARRLKEAGVL